MKERKGQKPKRSQTKENGSHQARSNLTIVTKVLTIRSSI